MVPISFTFKDSVLVYSDRRPVFKPGIMAPKWTSKIQSSGEGEKMNGYYCISGSCWIPLRIGHKNNEQLFFSQKIRSRKLWPTTGWQILPCWRTCRTRVIKMKGSTCLGGRSLLFQMAATVFTSIQATWMPAMGESNKNRALDAGNRTVLEYKWI